MTNEPDNWTKCEKNDMAKWVSVSISKNKNTASLKCKMFCQNRPTETYHTPNWRKFYEDFDGLFRFEIATFFQGENTILLILIYMHIPYYIAKY